MKVIDYIKLISYGKFDYYDTKFSINNTGIKGNFTMNDFCQRLALTEEVLNMEIEIIEDTPKEDNKIEKIKCTSIKKTMGLDCKIHTEKIHKEVSTTEIIEKINEIIDKINGE